MCEKLLVFSYEMYSEFDREITRHDFRLLCIPRDGEGQRTETVSFRVSPYTWLSEGRDGFGNPCIYGAAGDHHSTFSVRVEGRVRTGLCGLKESRTVPHEVFLYQTPMTAPGTLATRYFEKIRTGGKPQALYLMECLHRDFAYQSGVTDTGTTSEQALEKGCGVCQDYAHLLITLCRMAGIPARYVAGMVVGEGETHAWVEVFADGKWQALDPTQNCIADGRYIKLSHGRDCRDCLVNRGIFFNPARETQTVRVRVAAAREGRALR